MNPVLVLGSKPGSPLPAITPSVIYAANGAAELMRHYPRKKGIERISVCGGGTGGFLSQDVAQRVQGAEPDRIILLRTAPYDVAERTGLRFVSSRFEFLTLREQTKIQADVIGAGLIWKDVACHFQSDVVESRGRRLVPWIKYAVKCGLGRRVHGVSTGLFAILLAGLENPESEIIVSGIGLRAGGHFYKRGQYHGHHACIDRYAAQRMPTGLLARLKSVDPEFCKITGVSLYKKQVTVAFNQ